MINTVLQNVLFAARDVECDLERYFHDGPRAYYQIPLELLVAFLINNGHCVMTRDTGCFH